MPKAVNLVGARFGLLSVLARGELSKHGNYLWQCRCDCGNVVAMEGYRLKGGTADHCGCLTSQRRTKHGRSRSRVYQIFRGMHARCENPKTNKYYLYGGRGIIVCERWRTFENFYADMGDPPSTRHSIDRKDGSKNYEPDNCRWATYTEQARNSTRNVFIEFGGHRATIAEWADLLGIEPHVLGARIRKGEPPAKAFSR